MMSKGWKGVKVREPGWIGIDPGNKGGISYVTRRGAEAWKMPQTPQDIWNLLKELTPYANMAVLENVHSWPKDSAKNAFTFGKSFGGLWMGLAASGVRYELVPPTKWMTSLNCKTGGDKNVTKNRAQQLWPTIKVTHFIADALLLGEYCRLHGQ